MLGSPNPQSNNVAEETLGFSVFRILTGISLLMPAFSLLTAPVWFTPEPSPPSERSPTLRPPTYVRASELHLRFFVLASLHFRRNLPIDQ